MTSSRTLDHEVAAALAALPIDIPTQVTADQIPQLRELMEALVPTPPPTDKVLRTEHVVPGDSEVTISIHSPVAKATARPCVVWIHGGGLVSGTFRAADIVLQDWCERFDCIGVSVKYRLAPEHPFPAALHDCYAGLKWVHSEAEQLGIDPDRIGVVGGSAGGNLAAGLALYARDQGEVPLSFQLLMCPMLDDSHQTPSSQWPSPTWDSVTNETAWKAYLGDLSGNGVPAYAAPSRATDLTGLPPAFISVGGADIFLDQDVAYALALTHAGVPTELHVYPEVPHGFENLAPNSAVGRQAKADLDSWLSRMLSR